jgi:hypothetical protein
MKKHFLFLAFVACIMFACKPDLEKPTVVTSPISQITETSAVAGGEVTSDGGAEVTSRGVCWSLVSNPTIENEKTVDGVGVGSFQSSLSSLSQNTTYYLRAYATNSEGTSYGKEVSFTTLEIIDDDTDDDTDDNDNSDDDNSDDTEDDEEIVISTNQGEPLAGMNSFAGQAYLNICKRVLGQEVPLMDLEKKRSILTKVSGLFKRADR